MQHVENDMDELFRKAAENYPLKTAIKKWDEIIPALAYTSLSGASIKQGKKRYFLFILLTMIVLTTALSIVLINNISVLSFDATGSYSVKKKSELIEKYIPDHSLIKEEILADLNEQKKFSEYTLAMSSGTHKSTQFRESGYRNSKPLPVDSTVKNGVNSFPKISNPDKYDNNSEIHNLFKSSTPHTLIPPMVVLHNDSILAEDINADNFQHKSDQIKSNPDGRIRKSGLYFGIVAGPQVNQVKGQGFIKAGLSMGFLTGYRFNKKLSIEGGLFYSRKHYFSDGKYFDMSKNSMPSNMQIISLRGSSSIFEIPVRLKYDFAGNNKTNWFLTSGFSSYLLTNESNNYFALLNGSQQNLTVNYTRQKSYFPFAFNLSFGYEIRTGQKTNVRIEPYIQIPIRGIGVGSLPVMTTGIYVGITNNTSK